MEACLYDNALKNKTELQIPVKVYCYLSWFCTGWKFYSQGVEHPLQTTMQINPPKAGYYPHSHNFQLVQNTGRGYFSHFQKKLVMHARDHTHFYTRNMSTEKKS